MDMIFAKRRSKLTRNRLEDTVGKQPRIWRLCITSASNTGLFLPCKTRKFGNTDAPPPDEAMPGKRVQFDDETWQSVDLLAREQMKDFQELADEAFRDLLRKHGRPANLKEALRRSAGDSASVHQISAGKKPRKHR